MNPVKLWSPEEQKFYNEKVWHQTTIGDELAMWCERFSDNTALISGEVKVSYRTLAAEVAGMASFFRSGISAEGTACFCSFLIPSVL